MKQLSFAVGDTTGINIFNPVYRQFPKPDEDTIPSFGGDEVEVDRLGIYLQDQISIFDNLKLLAGLRYDTVDQDTTLIPGAFTESGEVNRNYDALTPRLGIVYQPIEEVSLYASYSRSFNPNTQNTVSGDPFEPEKGEGYEVGIKGELLDNLFATLAYFDITKQNVAVTDPNNSFFSIPTGEQHSRGVELDVTGEVLPGWNIIAAYAYIDAEVTADTNTDIVGNRLFNVPKHSASLWTTYEIQSGRAQGLGFGVGFNYVGLRKSYSKLVSRTKNLLFQPQISHAFWCATIRERSFFPESSLGFLRIFATNQYSLATKMQRLTNFEQVSCRGKERGI